MLTLAGDRVSAITHFVDSSVLGRFGWLAAFVADPITSVGEAHVATVALQQCDSELCPESAEPSAGTERNSAAAPG